MSTIEITKENFQSVIDTSETLVLDCWASWCGPCKAFAPVFEAASQRYPEVVWGKLDTEAQQELAAAFEIQAIPTVMVFRQQVLLFRQAGMLPARALDQLIEQIRGLDMDEVRREIEEHERAHAEGRCNHDHGHDHDH